MTILRKGMPDKMYLFWRLHNGKEYFYPVSLWDDEDVIPNVELNSGTIRVTDPIDNRVVWSLQ